MALQGPWVGHLVCKAPCKTLRSSELHWVVSVVVFLCYAVVMAFLRFAVVKSNRRSRRDWTLGDKLWPLHYADRDSLSNADLGLTKARTGGQVCCGSPGDIFFCANFLRQSSMDAVVSKVETINVGTSACKVCLQLQASLHTMACKVQHEDVVGFFFSFPSKIFTTRTTGISDSKSV